MGKDRKLHHHSVGRGRDNLASNKDRLAHHAVVTSCLVNWVICGFSGRKCGEKLLKNADITACQFGRIMIGFAFGDIVRLGQGGRYEACTLAYRSGGFRISFEWL